MVDTVLRSKLIQLYPILKQISAQHLDEAFLNSMIVRYKAGEQIFEETQKIRYFPFVLKGNGRVYKLAPNGRELHLYSVGPGDGCVIATGSLLNDSTSNARAVCEADYEMVALPIPAFKTLLAKSDVFRDYVLSDLSQHLSQLTEMVSAILFQNLDQRLASSLVSKKSPVLVTHQTLADELGSVREIISRLLGSFADRGWIELQRGQIHVLKPQDLKNFANSNSSVT